MEENGKDASGGSTGYIRIGGEFYQEEIRLSLTVRTS